jgi:hypothetical protein
MVVALLATALNLRACLSANIRAIFGPDGADKHELSPPQSCPYSSFMANLVASIWAAFIEDGGDGDHKLPPGSPPTRKSSMKLAISQHTPSYAFYGSEI